MFSTASIFPGLVFNAKLSFAALVSQWEYCLFKCSLLQKISIALNAIKDFNRRGIINELSREKVCFVQ